MEAGSTSQQPAEPSQRSVPVLLASRVTCSTSAVECSPVRVCGIAGDTGDRSLCCRTAAGLNTRGTDATCDAETEFAEWFALVLLLLQEY